MNFFDIKERVETGKSITKLERKWLEKVRDDYHDLVLKCYAKLDMGQAVYMAEKRTEINVLLEKAITKGD